MAFYAEEGARVVITGSDHAGGIDRGVKALGNTLSDERESKKK